MSIRKVADSLWRYLLLSIISLIFLLPIIWLVVVSVETPRNVETSLSSVMTALIDNYSEAWRTGGFESAFINTFVISIFAVLLSDLLGLPMAFVLARAKGRGYGFMERLLFFFRMLPEMVFLLPLFVIYRKIGLFDTAIGMILAFQIITLPYTVVLLKSYIYKLSPSLEDAGRVDGCTERQVLFQITAPAIATGLAATSILCFISIWTNLMFPLVLSYSEAQTVSIAIASFKGYGTFKWSTMAAGAVLTTLPQLILFGFINKYLVAGLTAGAVKE